MKTTTTFLIGCLLLILNTIQAQNKCCNGAATVIPELTPGFHSSLVPLNQNTPSISLSVNASSDLPNVEYIITKRGTAAADGGGDVIVGADADGVFRPMDKSRYGISLATGDVFDLTAIGYNLALMRNLTDALLNNVVSGSGPCCSLFVVISAITGEPAIAGFCDTLHAAGIYGASDVNDFEDVLVVLQTFLNGKPSVSASIASVIAALQMANSNGTFISVTCGGTASNNFVPYGINTSKKYGYEIGAPLLANTCCAPTTIAPEVSPGVHGNLIPLNQNTPSISLAVNASSDLPNVEYIVSKRGTLASNGSGEVILGSDIDGVFMPMDKSRYGISLAVGDTFDLTAFGYDLPLMKHLMDSLLNAVTINGPCCNLFNVLAVILNEPALAGFCDSVNNAGIYTGNDINELEDLLVVFDLFSGNQSSVTSLISTLETINSSGIYISTNCGGTGTNNFLPYGINKNKKYGYVIDNPLIVQQLSDISLFLMYPNPTTAGDVQVYFTTTKQIDLNINLYDALGQKVHSQTLGNVSGDFNTQIPTTNLAAGMYFVELTDGHNSQTHKLHVK